MLPLLLSSRSNLRFIVTVPTHRKMLSDDEDKKSTARATVLLGFPHVMTITFSHSFYVAFLEFLF